MKRRNPIQPILSLVSPIQTHLTHYLLPLAVFLLLAGMALAAAPTQAAVVSSWCETPGQEDIPDDECMVLEEFYLSTSGESGDSWINKSGWLDSPAICSWHGVTCSEINISTRRHIIRLELSTNNLVGTIPESLSALTALVSLDLTDNQLSGPIPTSIGDLTALTDLHLGSNQLDGSIPSSFSQLDALQRLDLGKNMLSGPIPPELGQLTQLNGYIYLGGNRLEGLIPESVCNLPANLGGNIDYNKLDVDVSDQLPDTCDDLFLQWESTQTVPPTSLAAEVVEINTVQNSTDITAVVEFSWVPILYQEDGGYYVVLTRDLETNNIETLADTSDRGGKTATGLRFNVPGDPENFAYFVRTVTPEHAGNPENELTSVDSEEVEIDAVAIRMLDIRANTPLLYLPALAPLALLLLTGLAVLAVFRKQ